MSAATIELVRVVETCAGCPSQWDGWDAAGQYYYMRYRHGQGTVHAEPGPDPDTWTTFPANLGQPFSDGAVAAWDDGTGSGYITLHEFLEAAHMTLAPGIAETEEPATKPPGPAVVSEGRYTVFETSSGGRHIAYRPDGDEEDQHLDIPAAIVSIARGVMEGGEPPSMGTLMRLFRGRK